MGGKNETSFKLGVSGNPNGAPKKPDSIAGILRSLGEELDEENEGTDKQKIMVVRTRNEHMLRKVILMAQAGSLDHVKFIADRVDGKAVARIETATVEMPEFLDDTYPDAVPERKDTDDD